MKGKRALAILISLVLTVGMLTVGTFAAEGEGNPVNNNTPTEEGGQQEGGQQEGGQQEEKNQEPENTPPAQEKEEDPCKDGHDYVLDQSQSVQATCTSDGVNVYVCSRCGDSKKEPGDQALGHQYDEGVVTKEPTEDKEGVKTFTCIRGDDNYTEPIPKLEKKEPDPVPESSNLSIGFDVITNDSGKVDAGKGSIEYKYEHKGKGDKEKVTLTLKKATLKANENKGQTQAPAAAIYYAGNGTLVLSLKDENTVTGLTYAICAPNATIQIKTEEKDASLTAKAAPQNSNAIRGKKIDLDKSLGITDPENAYIFEGQNDDRSTYETVTFNNNGHNQAATSVTIQIPEIKVIYTDGAGNEKTDKVRKGDDCKLADCDFDAPEDQEFDHWEIAGESYDAGDEVEITEETTVTAVWKEKEPEVTDGSKKTASNDKSGTKDDEDQNDKSEPKDKEDQKDKDDQKDEKEEELITEGPEGKEELPGETPKKDQASPSSLSIGTESIPDTTEEIAAGSGRIKIEREGAGASEKITLTLDSATVDSGAADAAISYTGEGELIIVIKGENTLSGMTSGIYAPKATVTFNGEKGNSLEVKTTAASTSVMYAVFAKTITPIASPLTAAVTAPDTSEESKITDGQTDTGESYQTIGYGNDLAAAGVKIEVPDYKVTFDANGGGGSMTDQEKSVTNGETFTLPKCAFTAPTNKEFDQWQVNDDGKYDPGDAVTITKTTVVKALWKDKYLVTFDANGGGGSMADQEKSVASGEKITLPECAFTAPANKEFDQWQVNDDGKYDPGDVVTITKTTVVKALWKDKGVVVEKWTISFQANGGSGSMANKTVTKGQKYTLPENQFTAPNGKDFDQWQIDNNKYDSSVSVDITKDTTVKATWKDHTWSEPTYSWSSDNSTCTATRKCTNKGCKESETETAKTSKGGTATCEKDGVVVYTAEFTNSAFTTQEKTTTETQEALGHIWGKPVFSWSDNYSKATATFTCTRDKSHTQEVEAEKVTGSIKFSKKENTDIKMEYTATATLDGKKYTDQKEQPIARAEDKGYVFIVPAQNQTASWTMKSKNSLTFTIKRNEYDAMTFEAFSSLTVDGKAVKDEYYTAEKGSLKLTFKPAYLNTLTAGQHTLKVQFYDGSAQKKFNVTETGKNGSGTTTRRGTTATGSPRTGDYSNWALWIGLIAVSAVGIGAVLYFRKRNNKKTEE